MPAAVAAPIIASVIGAGGAVAGGLIGSSAAKSAAGTQQQNALTVADLLKQAGIAAQGQVGEGVTNANNLLRTGVEGANPLIAGSTANANETLSDIFNREYANLSPYLAAGTQGIDALKAAIGPGGDLAAKFAAPTAEEAAQFPGYQFVLQQGTKAIMNNAAASGLSGGTLKNIEQFGQGTAGQYYQQAYNNALQTFGTNRNATMQNLQAMLGLGEFGTGQFQAAGENYGNRASGNLMTSGLAQGANITGSANQQGQNVLRGSEIQANTGTTIAEAIASAMTGGANAKAAGTVGAANAWEGALGGVTNAAQFYSLADLLKQNGITAPVTGAMPPGYTQPSVAAMAPYNPPPIPALFQATPVAPPFVPKINLNTSAYFPTPNY